MLLTLEKDEPWAKKKPEHRTSNVERRRMKSLCSVIFYKNDTPKAYHSSTLDVRLLFKFNVYFFSLIGLGLGI